MPAARKDRKQIIWIIAGGRHYREDKGDYRWLDELVRDLGRPSQVIHGGASGADALAYDWAKMRSYPVKEFPAHWDVEGRAAGPIRNKRMATYAKEQGGGFCILFPGGKGTASMKLEAELAGLKIIEREPWLETRDGS